MKNYVGMSDITVDVAPLIETVRKNRDCHRATFELAVENWRKAALEAVNEWADKVKDSKEPFRLYSGLVVPEEHTDDYDRALRMLTMHQGVSIQLSEEAYTQLVEDDWGWRQSWAANTLSYTK